MGSAGEQPRVTAVQPPSASSYVVEADGNQRARPTAEVLRNQPLLERAVDLQINQIRTCITTLEAMRSNLSRMETALVLLETGVVEHPNPGTVVEVIEAPTEDGEEAPGVRRINQSAEADDNHALTVDVDATERRARSSSAATEVGIRRSPTSEADAQEDQPPLGLPLEQEAGQRTTTAKATTVEVNLEESEPEATADWPRPKRSKSQGSPPPTGGSQPSSSTINQVRQPSPRQQVRSPSQPPPRGDRRNQQLPTLPDQRVPYHKCPAPYSTVYVKGLRDYVDELTYVEWLNSIGGTFNRRCNAISAVSIGLHATDDDDNHTRYRYRGSAFILYATAELAEFAISELHNREVYATGRWLYLQRSQCPISTKTSRGGILAGQPRTGEEIFSTFHPGYPSY